MSFFDFNSASEQTSFDLIPKGALVRVRMTVKPGGFDDASQGWTGGYATRNDNTGSVYLNCEFVVMEGQYARRKMWSLIGLYSPKGPEWSNMGRTFIKAVLNSARAIHPNDNGPAAQNARRINGFADLDGVVVHQQLLLDGLAVDVRAVGAVEVFDEDVRAQHLQHRVLTTDGQVVDDDVVVGTAAEGGLVLGDLNFLDHHAIERYHQFAHA